MPDADKSLEAETPTTRLRATLGEDRGWFAVVDGGHFDDVGSIFASRRLFARSLFLSTSDVSLQAAGPWLVDLTEGRAASDRVLDLVGDVPAVVFWRCSTGEPALWRHLRGLNMALLPSWAANGHEAPDPDAADATEAVIFRHWDPRVLGETMPALSADQFSRVLGPAQEIAFVSQGAGLRRVVRTDAWPRAGTGMLSISSAQAVQIGARHVDARYERMMAYIREAAPETATMSRDDLLRLIRKQEASAERMNLTNERSQSIWCFLMISSHDRFEHLPGVRKYLFATPGDPNQKVETLLHQMVRLAQTRADFD